MLSSFERKRSPTASQKNSISPRIARIDRIIPGIGVAVGADAGVGAFPPVGLDERRGSENPPGEGFPEARQFGVVVAGVEVRRIRRPTGGRLPRRTQPGIEALADTGLGGVGGGNVEIPGFGGRKATDEHKHPDLIPTCALPRAVPSSFGAATISGIGWPVRRSGAAVPWQSGGRRGLPGQG